MRQKKKWILWIVVLLSTVGILSVSFWYQNGKNHKKYEIVFIPKTEDSSNDFWTLLLEGAREAAEEYDASLTIWNPTSELDYEQQNEYIRRAIEEEPDLLVIAPSSYTESTQLLRQVKEKGIHLVFVDSFIDERIEDIFVGTDNVEAGKVLGEYVKDRMQPDTRIGIVSHVQGSSTAMEREQGFRQGLGDKEEYIQEVVYSGSDYQKAYEQTCAVIREHPEINLLVGLNEYTAVGAARAVRDLGEESRIQVVGFDSSLEQIKMMEEGLFQASVIQKSFNMGYLGVENGIRLLRHEKVEKNMNSGYQLVTKENMYTEENQKILFPFVGNKKRNIE